MGVYPLQLSKLLVRSLGEVGYIGVWKLKKKPALGLAHKTSACVLPFGWHHIFSPAGELCAEGDILLGEARFFM